MDSADAVTKADLEKALEAQTGKIAELIYHSETRLLRAFADYNSSANIRLRKLESDVSNVDTSSTLRLGKLEEKITDLEVRILKLEDRPPHRTA